jgi:hypothetical protein
MDNNFDYINYEQYVVTFIIGYLAYYLPRDDISVNPLFSSIIIGVFFSYVLYSDLVIDNLDYKDIITFIIILIMAATGGLLAKLMKTAEKTYTVNM